MVQSWISQPILVDWDHLYRNWLKNRKSDHPESRESENKKGVPRIRGPSDENFKSLNFDGILLKLGPVHKIIIRKGNWTHFW